MGLSIFLWIAIVLTLAVAVHTRAANIPPHKGEIAERELFLVQPAALILPYHNGPVLSSASGIPIYIIWYGAFSKAQHRTIFSFLASLTPSAKELSGVLGSPSVSSWWGITGAYKDGKGQGVSPLVKVVKQVTDRGASLGKNLKMVDIETLVTRSLPVFGAADPNALYLVFTAYNVYVEGFCGSSCGSHAVIPASKITNGQALPYGWVGHAGAQCPGQCAWPFAAPTFPGAPQETPLVSPNGDVGADGMIINIATVLAGAASNPFNTGYYQGDPGVPLEAATACQGEFGPGSYPGYPGLLLTANVSHASFNAFGIHGRKFLLPALWSPLTKACRTLP